MRVTRSLVFLFSTLAVPALSQLTEALAPAANADSSTGNALRGAGTNSSATIEAAAVPVNGTGELLNKLLGNFFAATDDGLHPENVRLGGGNTVSLVVLPGQEAVRVTSPQLYTGGRFEFKAKTASVMPGVITAVYLASGKGRTGDSSPGEQDEIDIEWKGNTPQQLQTNVFLQGADEAKVMDLGYDSSVQETLYAIDWDDHEVQTMAMEVRFFVNGDQVRSVPLSRPLKPMQLEMSVWTTSGGWDGLIQWAGSPQWNARSGAPVAATFEILSVPSS